MRNHLNSVAARFVGVLAVVFGFSLELGAWDCPVSCYKQDGLVACWDGFDNVASGEHDATASVWRDTVAGYEFALTGVTIGDRYLGFNGSAYGTLTTSATAAFPSGVKTVEIVIKLESSQGIALHGPTASGVSFGPFNGFILINNKAHSVGYSGPGTTVTNVYATVYGSDSMPSKFNCNGVSVSSANANNYWGSPDSDKAWLGKRSNGQYPFTGKIFAVRVYNRELSAEDIAHNYGVDCYRFFDDDSRFTPEVFAVDPIADQSFAAAEIRPAVSVQSDVTGEMRELTLGTDYTVAYSNNFALGIATVTVTGCGAYAAKAAATTFAIVPPSEARVMLKGDFTRQVLPFAKRLDPADYTLADTLGNPIDPTTYVVSATNDTATGTATVWARVTSGSASGAIVALPAAVAVLADGYQPVASLTSSGSQYINTGFTPGTATGLEMSFNTGTYVNQTAFFATGWNDNRYMLDQQKNYYIFHGANTYLQATQNNQDAHLTLLTTSADNCILRVGTTVTTNTVSRSNGGSSLYLFSAGSNYKSSYTLKSLVLTQSGTTACDFVPCFRVTDGAPGLYDVVRKTFYANAGSGTFTPGPSVNADFTVAAPSTAALLPDGATPNFMVTDAKTGARLTLGTDYTVTNFNNRAAGSAYAIVTGKGDYIGSVRVPYTVANVVFVKGDATGTGDGSSWANACTTLHAAFAKLGGTTNEIWIAGDVALSPETDAAASVTFSVAAQIRGGFAGTESSLSERADGTQSLYDGAGERSGLSLTLGASPVFERLRFERCKGRALYVSLKGSTLTMRNCAFRRNGYAATSNVDGLCIYAAGQGFFADTQGYLTLEDCVFEDNVLSNNTTTATTSNGQCLYLGGMYRCTLRRCTFARNGIASADLAGTSKATAKWAVIYGTTSAVTAENCRFIDNHVRGASGLIYLQKYAGSTVFQNCVFAGNEEYGTSSGSAGMVYINTEIGGGSNGKNNKCDFLNCTFAYNLSCATAGSAALNLASCAGTITNCLFYGNVINSDSGAGSDLQSVSATGAATVDYCLFAGDGVAYRSGPGLAIGTHNLAVADPLFVTGTNAFASAVVGLGTSLSRAEPGFHFDAAKCPSNASHFDLHLLSAEGHCTNTGVWHRAVGKLSKAIDAGDPATDYSAEPSPNGGRINLGAYGGTAEASKTAQSAQPVVTADDVSVRFLNGYTQPEVTVQMRSANPDDVYSATVTITIGGFSRTFENVQNGDTLVWKASGFLEPGAVTQVQVSVNAGTGTVAVNVSEDVTAMGVKPPWAGHGGSANVIHVFPGATGAGDGSSWTDAYTDFRVALDNVNATRSEVWVTTNVILSAETDSRSYTIPYAFTVRGGFTALEDTAEARPADTVTLYDGAGARAGLSFTLSATPTFERFRFVNCSGRAVTLAANGQGSAAVFDRCSFARCGYGAKSSINGLGISFSGYSFFSSVYGALTLTDCVFEDLTVSNNTTTSTSCSGAAIYTAGFGSLTMTRCKFLRNGVAAADVEGTSKAGCTYAAFYVGRGNVTATGCEFRNNRVRGAGGIIYLGSGTATFKNCVYTGNEEYGSSASGTTGGIYVNGATLRINQSTFAYNLSCAASRAAVLNLNSSAGTVSNSIFYANMIKDGSTAASDVYSLSASGALSVDYTLFADNDVSYFRGAGLTMCANNLFVSDPLFVTSTNDFMALVVTNGAAATAPAVSRAAAGFHFDHAREADVLNLDLHLLSTTGYVNNAGIWQQGEVSSRAIDAADRAAPFANEPDPNGGCANLGAYGNTAQASMTMPPDVPVILDEDFNVSFENAYTQPMLDVRITGNTPKAAFFATVTLYVGEGPEAASGEAYAYSKTFNSVQNGDLLHWRVSGYFTPGATIYLKAVADVGDETEPTVATKTVTAQGTKPAWAGHGGPANVMHVFPGATGTGDGSSWTDAKTSVRDALANLGAQHTEIWVSTNVFLDAAYDGVGHTIPRTLVIRGGFTCEEDTAEDRPEDTVSLYDGEGVRTGLSLSLEAKPTFERFRFVNCTGCALNLTAPNTSSAAEFRQCSFARCGYNAAASRNGLGICFSGCSFFSEIYGALTLTDCTFEDLTVSNNTTTATTCNGAAIYVNGFSALTMTNCKFLRNGIAAEDIEGESKAACNWAAIYVGKGAITARNCEFRNNRVRGASGIVYAGARSHLFQNCLFAGNEEYGASSTAKGAFYVDATAARFVNCTFAYNVSCANAAAAALNLSAGTTSVTNSIFFANVVGTTDTAGADFASLTGSGIGFADYCLFQKSSADCITGGGITLGQNNLYADDALFATSKDDFLGMLAAPAETTKTTTRAVRPFGFDHAHPELFADLDLHLLSKTGYVNNAGVWLKAFGKVSKAIDAGVPAVVGTAEADYSNETSPNGGRINLGCYGNTSEASRTPLPDRPALKEGDLTLAFVEGYAQPIVTVRPTGVEEGAVYSASVTVNVGLKSEMEVDPQAYRYTRTYYNVQPNDLVTWRLSHFFAAGDLVRASVTISTSSEAGTFTASGTIDREATGVKPIWAEHGGGAHVLHVNPGATGAGDGSSWTDAYTEFREALKNVSAARSEVWVTTNVLLEAANDGIGVNIQVACTIRGGFTGAEDALADRPTDTVSLYNGAGVHSGLSLTLTATPTFERFRFENCSGRAFYLGSPSTSSAAAFRQCSFARCGYGATSSVNGLAIHFSGCGFFSDVYGSLSCADCVFEDLVVSNNTTVSTSCTGGAIYNNGMGSLYLTNCVFRRNGIAREDIESSSKAGMTWAAIYSGRARVTAIDCKFLSNRVRGAGGICFFGGNYAKVFTRCLWAGNEEYGTSSSWAGTVKTESAWSDFRNCTFGYNVSGGIAAAALNVNGPATATNCIFYGNITRKGNAAGSDVRVTTATTFLNDYTLFGANDGTCVNGTAGAVITNGAHNVYGNARFMTMTRWFLGTIVGSELSASRAADGFHVNHALSDAQLDYNCHLASRRGYYDETTGVLRVGKGNDSPAIDAGDPAVDCSNEPVEPRFPPRLNLGCYGNTPWASMPSPAGFFLRVR